MAYRTAIFDLDGTLLNTLEDLWLSCNHALAAHGMPKRSLDEVRQFVGNGIALLIHRAVPTGTPTAQEARVLDEFKRHYAHHSADHTAPYPGITGMLLNLRRANVRIAVASNKADFAVGPLVERYFPGLVEVSMGEQEDAGIPKKPAPAMVEAILARLDTPKETAIYVGDSDVDIETAANAGIACASVSWGFRDAAFLHKMGASAIVDSAEELGQFILS